MENAARFALPMDAAMRLSSEKMESSKWYVVDQFFIILTVYIYKLFFLFYRALRQLEMAEHQTSAFICM